MTGLNELAEQARLRLLVGRKLLDVRVDGAGPGAYVLTFEGGAVARFTAGNSDFAVAVMKLKERA